MAKVCVTEKTAQRQRWIENGLLELMQERRFEEIGVTELCAHLGLARRSFYRYFSHMDDVLDSLLVHTFQDMAVPDALVGVEELRRNFDFWRSREALLTALARSGMSSKLMEYTLRFTDADTLQGYLEPGDPARDLRREVRLFVTGGLVSLVIAWHAEGFRRTPEQMARIAHRMLFRPILRQKKAEKFGTK